MTAPRSAAFSPILGRTGRKIQSFNIGGQRAFPERSPAAARPVLWHFDFWFVPGFWFVPCFLAGWHCAPAGPA
jgi:hypothetical protein